MLRYVIATIILSIALYENASGQSHKICTFNIKYDNPSEGVHAWDQRKQSIVSFIAIEKLDIIGMQEVLHNQLSYLLENLSGYKSIGRARDDGKSKGEFSPVLYNSKRYHLIDSATFWLSETPAIPSKGWDAAFPRVCSWAKLKDIKTADTLLVLNTHFDHVGKKARAESVDLILSKIDSMNFSGKIILMGDFNLEPNALPIQHIKKVGFKDAYYADLNLGPQGTFNGFKIGENYDRRIDYVFYQHLEPLHYCNFSLRIENTFLSDHFPVIVEFK